MCSLRCLTVVSVALLTLAACEGDHKLHVSGMSDPETTPTMLTRDVETLISDSGIVRYHISSPLWLMFDEASEPSWRFPEGIKLLKYDNFMRQEATVQADSATYLSNPQLWRLDGNVRIANTQGVKFLTEQLFWDQRNRKVYSDSFIHIEQPDRILEGYGFVSNERLTTYSIHRVSGIFPVKAPQRESEDSTR